jgi:hypothetical protein
MKNTATFLTMAELKNSSVSGIAGAEALEDPLVEVACEIGLLGAGAAFDEAEIVGLEVLPIRERRFVDIEHNRRLSDLVNALLEVATRVGENQLNFIVIIAGLIRKQLLLMLVDIDRGFL